MSNSFIIGDVIKLKIPIIIFDDVPPILKRPKQSHYAVVIADSDNIRNKSFNGKDCIKMTHFSGNSPKKPYLSKDSFEIVYNEAEMERFLSENNSYSSVYSVPNEKQDESAICSIHNNARLKSFKLIGHLTEEAINEFKAYYSAKYNEFNHILIDAEGEPYIIWEPRSIDSGEPYLTNHQGNPVMRQDIREALKWRRCFFKYRPQYSHLLFC
ncbi:hypothetical protein IJT93_02890 [bacterium]|nr:hypothetical protein [bacterium]